MLNDLERPQYAELKLGHGWLPPGDATTTAQGAGYPLLATRLQPIFNPLQPLVHRLAGRFQPIRSHPVVGDT